MLHVALYEPEIPPNTGNIIRLCANTGARLHLIHPLGFALDDKRMRRAGLDYHEWADVQQHPNFAAFMQQLGAGRLLAFSTRSPTRFDCCTYRDGDVLLFGPETRGLPPEVLDNLPEAHKLRLPMQPNQRSLNLSNAVAVAVFEAWRQLEFNGAV